MAFDPYHPCPCGSGKKFKWCCQPVYVQIDKAFQQDAEGQHEVALRIMDTVCAEHPGNPEVWGRKAQLLYQLDRVDDSEACLQKAFDINPNYPFGHYLRGRFRHFEGEMAGSLQLFRKAAELYDPAAHSILAQIYSLIAECELKLNRPVAAHAALETAAKKEPGNPNYKAAIDQVFGTESKMPLVVRRQYTVRNAGPNAPAEQKAAWQRAMQAAGSDNLADAVKAFEQLTKEAAGDAGAWFNLALSKARLGDNAGAVAALERSVELNQDEEQAAADWALAEVLLGGKGMEEQSSFVQYSADFPIRNPEQVVRIIERLQEQRRLLGMQAREEDGILTGMIVEKTQALTPELAATQVPRFGAYFFIAGDILRVWNVNRSVFDALVEEVRQLGAGSIGEPYIRTGPAHFSEILSESLAFPVNAKDEDEAKRRMEEHTNRYFEDQWPHKPLRSIVLAKPIDAAANANTRKKLRGHIQFLADCAAAFGVKYDFDRLRSKLGLLGPIATSQAAATRDFTAMSAEQLATVDPPALAENELEAAYQAALKLGAAELVGRFATALVAKPPTSGGGIDRYPIFNQLIQQALSDGNADAALDRINEGEKFDSEHNEGNRRNDFELRRAQVHAKRGEVDLAAAAFDRLLERAPTELRYRGAAAEAMLSAKQPKRALQFAEAGLKKSREQNNRDSEQYFMELTAAAKKQGA